MGQRIGHDVVFALLLLDYVRERLYELYPLSMPLVELGLPTQIFECLVVEVLHKLPRKEVVAPCLEDSNKCLELLVVGRVV